MFTGIIKAVGNITAINQIEDAYSFSITAPANFLDGTKLGDSICVQGVCLTVTNLRDNTFDADVSAETVRCTTFSESFEGKSVNLELALSLADRLGGHLVTGHVDGVGTVISLEKENDSTCITIESPTEISKYIARKGSICIDGISLTVNSVDNHNFKVNIIPHTFENTAILDYKTGTKINLEIDLVARYIERLHSYGNSD